ncbi:amidohydrolase [Brevibacillus choshinensis]|uniref:Amidohydrolase n=1 Tax=Brevibacillus choshinensis TaxID=54911 RepID=A0ABR5N3G0_BRECH|nr:amidohydrolase [Brevibacillus choshinensis]KQL45029.1 amidohydrolase [Brevibacillus choshinensis]MED4583241.1 amidohydrolase [Brevibacillus choshinensis]
MKKKWTLLSVMAVALASVTFSTTHAIEKKNADLIIKNGHVLTMNSKKDRFANGTIVVKDNKIVAVGDEKLADEYSAPKVVDAGGDIVMPGMVNTHNHVPMVAFRSIGEEGVGNRLFEVFFPLEGKLLSRDLIYKASIHGVIEMAMGGVTTYSDMYYHEDEIAKATETIGIRGVLGETVISSPVVDAPKPYGGLQYAEEFIKQYKNNDLIIPAVAPHATYTVSPEMLKASKALADKYKVPFIIHAAEFADETQRIEKKFGVKSDSVIKYFDSIGILDKNTILAHAIHISDEDIQLIKQRGASIAHNPIANTKGATGVAPAIKIDQAGIAMGLGTDGPMSSNTMDVFGTMGYAARVHKLVNKDQSLMPPSKVVELATIGGAKALGLGDKIGSLEEGKLADIIIVDVHAPNTFPTYDPYATLAYAAGPQNVTDVIVNGKIIVENKMLKTYDYQTDLKDMTDIYNKVKEVEQTLEFHKNKPQK